MALSNATRLSDFGSGIGTAGAVIQVDNANKRVGIGTTNPQAMLQVGQNITMDGGASGVITATSFVGSGADLTDVISGIGITDSSVTSNLGTGLTAINFSGATVTFHEATGISTVTIAGWSQEDTWLFGS